MAKKTNRGRPRVSCPLNTQLNVRVSQEIREAIEAYQAKHGSEYELREISDVVRHLLKRSLRQEGLIQ